MTAERREEAPSILSRAFAVLDAFTEKERVLTLTDLSRKTNLPKSTIHRLIQRLLELGALEEHVNGYRLGIRFLRQISSMPVEAMREIALPYLVKLSEWSKATTHIAVLRGSNVVILQAIFAPDKEFPSGPSGSEIPARFSALGRAMMAFLPQEEQAAILEERVEAPTPHSMTDDKTLKFELQKIAMKGYAVQRNEVVVGLGNIAFPILIKNRPVGAIALQINHDAPISDQLLDAMRVTTRRIAIETRKMLANDHEELFPIAD